MTHSVRTFTVSGKAPPALSAKRIEGRWAPRSWRWAVILLMLCLGGQAQGQDHAYYSITSVTCEQLNNAVRVKIEADGAIWATIDKWWNQSQGESASYYMDWALVKNQTTNEWSPDCYPKVPKILIHANNAQSQIGSVAKVGKYPINHVRFLTTQEGGGSLGLDIEVVLYKPMRFRRFALKGVDTWDAYMYDHHDPAWFEVVLSPDQRSLIITATSDRLPDTRDHLKLTDVPESRRELSVGFRDGLLDIHARNAGLAELADAVSRAGGPRTLAEGTGERVITAELPGVTYDEFIRCVARTYGLARTDRPDGVVLSDMNDLTPASQPFVRTESVPVRWTKAGEAVNLLPNFLADYVQVDDERNALIVTGSEDLIRKVQADLAQVDQPPRQVLVEARMIESKSSSDLARELGLSVLSDKLRVSTHSASGEVTYSNVGPLTSDFEARLRALVSASKAKIVSTSSVSVVSGRTGEIFAGAEQYIVVRRRQWDVDVSVERVSAGARLSITPYVGERAMTVTVAAETTEVGETDPASGLPVINARSVTGTFRAAPGETLLIGGLSERGAETAVRKVPILGDLPIFGTLFRRKARLASASELTVLLTFKKAESNAKLSLAPYGYSGPAGGEPTAGASGMNTDERVQ